MTALPAEVQTAIQTLIEFEGLDLVHKTLRLDRFSKAQQILRDYLRANPSAPHAERVRRYRVIYMRTFLGKSSDIDMDFAPWLGLAAATFDLRRELEPSFKEEPDLYIAWEDLMTRHSGRWGFDLERTEAFFQSFVQDLS